MPMESAGLALGVISLFNAVLTGYKQLTTSALDQPPEKLQQLYRRARIQHARLRVWGENWGLTAQTRELHDLDRAAYHGAFEALRSHLTSRPNLTNEVLDALNALGEVLLQGARHGVARVAGAPGGEPRDRAVADLVANVSPLPMGLARIEAREAALRYLARCRWRIVDAAAFERLVAQLRGFTDDLYSWVRAEDREMMDRALVAELLAGQHDVRVLLHYADAAAAEARDRSTPIEGAYAPAYRNLAQAAKLRARANLDPFMHERLLQPPAELAQDAYQLVSSKVWSAPAACLAVQARPPRVVLVEWKRFDLPGVREATAIGWILALAEQLCAPQKPAALCVPACAGYFRALHERRYGLVFELPAHVGRYADLRRRDLHLRKPATLADLLADAAGRDAIDLGTRFRLAKLLAAAVHAAHTAGTTHKNIRASSVYFFPEESADGDGGPSKSRRKALDKPCLLDWGYVPTHIAPDAGTAVARVDPYHHPRRAKAAAGQVFLHSWDVYALGLVLLEIGLWQPLEAFMEELDDGAGPDAWRTHIMTRCVPDLRAQCGGIYESVVRKCLDLHYPGGEREVEVEKTLCWDICARLMLCNA